MFSWIFLFLMFKKWQSFVNKQNFKRWSLSHVSLSFVCYLLQKTYSLGQWKRWISVVKCCYSNHICISQELARGNAWKAIAAQLTAAPFSFKVDAWAVRERFGGLVERFKAKNREKLVAIGVSPEQSQLDIVLDEIVQKMEQIYIKIRNSNLT